MLLSYAFPDITGITFDSAGDVFVSYDSATRSSGQQQAVAEVGPDGDLLAADLFGTSGSSASPGVLTTVSASDSLPGIAANEILELEPDGQLFEFNPISGVGSQYDDLADDTANASSVYDVQTGTDANLSSQISLSGATYGDFGVYDNALVVSAESNDWDFVLRLTYSAQGNVATVLAASPVSGGLSAAPGGVAVDSQGTVLATLPYLPTGASTAIHVAVGFNLFYDQGDSPQPTIPDLGLQTVANIDSTGITVDSQNNFILALSTSSLYGGGPGVAHINSALTAFLADPLVGSSGTPSGIAYQDVAGTNYLAIAEPGEETYTIAYELSLFSGQVTPAQLQSAYGIDQIRFPGPDGTTVTGDGSGQTIAIVEEGEDPTLGADLQTFDQFFGIPAPPSFEVVNQNGVVTPDLDIVAEASLDVEWAHATAPGASIVVYNAEYEPDNELASIENLFSAMKEASELPGVSVVTLSYGVPEAYLAENGVNEQSFDSDFTTPGVTFLAASGDNGIYGDGGNQVEANYPAASPNIVAVGGTSIVIDAAGDYPGTSTSGEVGWGAGTESGNADYGGGSGGGLSAYEPEPSWQSQSGVVPADLDPTGARAIPDVAMDAGVAQPYDVFTSTLGESSEDANPAVGWLGDAGTSAASPIWAGLIAIADQGRVLEGGTPLTGYTQTLPALYALPAADFHDIVNGDNGYGAGPGYDLVTGRGSPIANLLVPALASYGLPSQVIIATEPPSSVVAGRAFGLTVDVTDSQGNPVNGGTVTIALANNPGGATLGGTVTASVVNGVATFSNLTLSQPGTGYTLTASDGTVSSAQPTTAITVTAASVATQIAVTTVPAVPVFGQSVTIQATVQVVSPGTGTPAGTVTFEEGTTVLGTATLTNGVASITTTPQAAGTESITIAYGGNGNDQASSVLFPLTVGQAAATLALSNLSATYDGASQFALASTNPAGLSGVTVTYTQNGATVAAPTQAGSYTVTATLDNPDYTAAPVTGTLVISQATPTTSWPAPADIVSGTALSATQLDATASVPGTFTYSPPAGTVLAVGSDQALSAVFTPTDSQDYATVTATTTINVDAAGSTGASPGIPNAPVLSPGSDTGVSDSDGITSDNGSPSAPLAFTVSGVSPSNAFVQLYDVTDASAPVALGSPVQAQNGTATITLSGTPLADGTHEIAATAATTAGGTPSAMSSATAVTIETSLRVTSISPDLDFYNNTTEPLPDNGQVVVTFNHWLAGITVNPTTGYASPPFSVMLIPSGPDGLTTQAQTGVYWAAPTGYDGGDLPVPATLAYQQNADGTSTLTLTPSVPLSTDIYLITVDGLSDLAGNPLENSAGVPGNYYASFDYRPSPAATLAPQVTAVTADNGTVVIGDNTIAQPDTIGIAFSQPMDTYTINTSTIQLLAQGNPTPLQAAVTYSPSTQTAYLTPETALAPGVQYTVSVSTSVTDDQGFPGPGFALAAPYTVTFHVSAGGAAGGSSPLAVESTSPPNGSLWTSPLGYGTVTFNEPITLSALGRFSAMLIPRTGGVTTGSSGYADVPVNAQLAFNPNTNQLIIVPTGTLPDNGTVYAFALSQIPAQNGSTLAGPIYSTFELNVPAASQVATPAVLKADNTVVTASIPSSGTDVTTVASTRTPVPAARDGVSPSSSVPPQRSTSGTRVSILTGIRSTTPAGPLGLTMRSTRRRS